VTLSVAIHTNGTLATASVTRSSGTPALDRAALSAVEHARLPAAPAGVSPGIHRFTLPISFAP
jgi:protein TonB